MQTVLKNTQNIDLNTHKVKNGYALLYAILLSGIVLIVGVSILLIGRKEAVLSGFVVSSNQAIYAADTGLECLAYKDSTGVFDPVTVLSGMSSGSLNVSCNGITRSLNLSSVNTNGNLKTYIFNSPDIDNPTNMFFLGTSQTVVEPCFSVVFTKAIKQTDSNNDGLLDPTDAWVSDSVNIRSSGYSSCSLNDSRQSNRVLNYTY